MNRSIPAPAISSLRLRLVDGMNMRRFSRETQRNTIRDVGRFATFLRRRILLTAPAACATGGDIAAQLIKRN